MDNDAYAQLRQYESDYDSAQGGIRRAAALWLLATLGAVSYALFRLQVESSAAAPEAARLFIAVVVAFLGSAGLLLLWFLDQSVYQKLLHSVFVLGLALERSNPELPPVRTALYASNLNISRRLSLFYMVPILVILVVLGFFCARLWWGLEPVDVGPILGLDRCLQRVLAAAMTFAVAASTAFIWWDRREQDLTRHFGDRLHPSFRGYLARRDFPQLRGIGGAPPEERRSSE